MAGDLLQELEGGAHGVGRERVHTGAEDELPPVGLADVDVQRSRHDDRVEEELDRLGHRRLQRVCDDRQAHPGHGGDQRRPPGGGVHHHRGGDRAPGGLHAPHPPAGHVDPGDLGLLVDLHAEGVGRPGVTPHHGVVADDPPRRVVERPEDRVPGAVGAVHRRDEAFDLVGADDPGVDPLDLVDLGPPAHGP